MKTTSPRKAKPEKFFSLNANYYIASDARPEDLLDDALLMLSTLGDTINTLAHGLSNEDGDMAANPRSIASMLFGSLYNLKMAENVVGAVHSGMTKQEHQA